MNTAMKKTALIATFTLLCLLSGFSLQAQKNVIRQHLLWSGVHLKFKFNDTYQIRQEVEERAYWFPWSQHQFMTRTFFERKLGKGWSAAMGFAYFLQSMPQDPNVKITSKISELRPLIELGYKQVISKKLYVQHRYWSEFRFFEQADGTFDYANNRSRYKIEIGYSPIAQLTLKAFNEIHLNFGKNIGFNVFDQNRYGASIQYMPLKTFGFELGYINWFQQRPTGIDFYSRQILRFTIHQTIHLKKQTKT
jgi:hypothetical protein